MKLFSTSGLLQNIQQSFKHKKKFLLAYSGGLDSHVLLHALAYLKKQHQITRLRVIHIDHGLQEISATWAIHCLKVCEQLTIPCEVVDLNLQIPKGKSLEAIARKARYQVFKEKLLPDEVLLMAHHQNDQAETILLQLIRGSGLNGLAAMPLKIPFAQGFLFRPLLPFTRQQLQQYALKHQLENVEDPSNVDLRYDRNFLRHKIIPPLKQRWTAINTTLDRAARLQGEALHLLEAYVEQDLEQVCNLKKQTLSIRALKNFSIEKQKAILRLWFKKMGFLVPSERKLKHVLKDVLYAKKDAMPHVHWKGAEIRRYRDNLYIMLPLTDHDASQVFIWDIQHPLKIPSLNLTLKPNKLPRYLHQSKKVITVRFRRGGERLQNIKNDKRIGSRSIKKIFQQNSILPWQRDRIPLVYIEDNLVMLWK